MSTETQAAEAVAEETKDAVETAETQEAQAEQPWYATYGHESEDTFRSEYEELKGWKGKAEDLTNKEKSVLELAAMAEKPWHNETFAKMDAFSKKTGITDARIISEVMNSTPDDLSKDPLRALVMAEAASNPEWFNQMGGAKGVEAYIREKYNLEAEGEITPTAGMKGDALKAIQSIEKMKSEVGEIQNPYNIAQQTKAAQQEAFNQKQAAAVAEYEKVSGGMKEVSIGYGEKSLTFKVSKEEIDKALAGQKDYLGTAFDVSRKEDREALQNHIKDQILFSKVKSGELLQEWEKQYGPDVARTVMKEEVFNGSSKEINRADPSPAGKKETIAQAYARERGIPIPREHQTQK